METNSLQREFSSSETPPRKVRTLKSIYKNCSFALSVAEPTSYEEAAKDEVWRQAMKEELAVIERNNTWRLVSLPEGKKTIGMK